MRGFGAPVGPIFSVKHLWFMSLARWGLGVNHQGPRGGWSETFAAVWVDEDSGILL